MARTEESEELTKEQRKAILDERAAFLAQAPLSTSQKDNELDVLELVISNERFAIEAKFVREANKLSTWTRLPCTPDFVLGLMNFRGQILPLIDLRPILELSQGEQKAELQIVVVQLSNGQTAIAVDEISGISSILEKELQDPKQLVSPMLAPLLKGMRQDRTAVLDVEKLFSDPRLIVETYP